MPRTSATRSGGRSPAEPQAWNGRRVADYLQIGGATSDRNGLLFSDAVILEERRTNRSQSQPGGLDRGEDTPCRLE